MAEDKKKVIMVRTSIKATTSFLFEVGTLRKIIRAHRQTLLTDDLSDSIASHSYRVAIIGYFLALEEKLDANKVMKMCLIHDTGETRSNDLNWVHKRFVKVFEEEIAESQFEFLSKNSEFVKLRKEYYERKTKESRAAKDADLLDELLLLREYEWQGNKEAKKWLKGEHHHKMLFTETAKRLAKEIERQRPSLWWDKLWTSKRR